MVSEGGVGSIGVWLVSAVPARAYALPMVVWAGGSDPVCVAVSGLCSLVTDVAASVVAIATCADVVVALTPTTFASTVVVAAAAG